MPVPISDLIRRIRVSLGLTQAELAARLDVTVQTVNRWEREEASPRPEFESAFRMQEPSLLLLERVSEELRTVGALVDALSEEIRKLGATDFREAVFNRRAFDMPQDLSLRSQEAFRLLRADAYGRLVRARDLDTENEQIYRVAWGGRGWQALRVYSRNAPLIRSLMTAEVGDVVNVKVPGGTRELEIVEVCLLTRHQHLHGHDKDFLQLDLASEQLDGRAQELSAWLHDARQRVLGALALGEQALLAEPEEAESPPLLPESRAELGQSFFMQPLEQQEEVMSWPPRGLVLVTGIAGSGKTSVALGRAAMLFMEREDEPTPFRPEASIGFVLSEQLEGYLEGLLRGPLRLERMPVRAFSRQRQELLRDRQFFSGAVKRVDASPGTLAVSGMRAYAALVQRHLARHLVQHWLDSLPEDRPTDAEFNQIGWSQWRRYDELWSEFRDRVSALAQRAESGSQPLRGLVEAVDEVRAYLADSLEHLSGWEGAKLKKARLLVRTLVRRRLLTSFSYPERYLELVDSPHFCDELRNLDADPSLLETFESKLRQRAGARELDEGDIDCLLLCAMQAGEGYTGRRGAQPLQVLTEGKRYAHVFIDEVQDFTEVQVELMASLADPQYRAVTAVGDFAQRLNTNGIANEEGLRFARAGRSLFLERNKRQTAPLHALGSAFRERVQDENRPMLGEPPSQIDEAPFLLCEDTSELADALVKTIVNTREEFNNFSIAVLCPTEERAHEIHDEVRDELYADNIISLVSSSGSAGRLCDEFHVHFTTPAEVKGLEFHAVFMTDMERYDMADPIDRDAVYVGLTRARRRLGVAWSEKPAGKLGEVLRSHLEPRIQATK
jgi:transcriptional regulator with XRE-family HTH domain